MKIPYNWVYIQPDPTNQILLPSGHTLYLDTRFEEQGHAPTYGTVIGMPDALRFSRDASVESVQFDVPMELELNDKVIFHFNSLGIAKEQGRIFDRGFMVRYDSLFAAIRGDKVIPLNGNIIVEPESAVIRTNLFIPEIAKKKAKQVGRVLYAGSKVADYRYNPDEFDGDVEVGDRILFIHYNAVPLQHFPEIHGKVKKTMLYRMQRKDVDAVLPEELEIA